MSLESIARNTPISEVMNRESPALGTQIYNRIKKLQQYGFRNSFRKAADYAGKFLGFDDEIIKNKYYQSEVNSIIHESSDKDKKI